MAKMTSDGWKKIDDNKFSFNEGSLNFTLTGGVFHDNDGDGIPDGVVFFQGRPVFSGIKDLKDFHFDVPRGYLVVNGNEYKLVDLDGNNDNGEELQLSKESVGFPEGNDRTNASAYKKVAENQFTYNEGSLNYTLTGAAFHDNDNDGLPDGVRIIGPKPCFGPGFDTSVDNFHFKVPSGVLIVNGQNYQLAELDDNPDNGYELVIPEVKLGWQKIEGGWSYTRPSDNDPDTVGTLKFYAENFDTTGVTFPVIRMMDMSAGLNERVTQFVVKGLKGVVNLNNPNYPIGVYNADNYGLTITKHGGSIIEYRLSEVAPNATIAIHSDVTFIDTIGDGSINVLSSQPFVLNGQKIDVQGEKYLTIDLASSQIINEEVLGWKKVGKKFEFVGRPSNDPTQVVNFTISGKNIKDMDKDGKPDDIEVDVLRKVRGLGIRAGIKGLNGEVKLNGKSIGVQNDVDYSIHFTPIIDPNIAPELMDQAKGFELINISPGAKINSPGSWVILDSEGTYHFSDGEYLVSDKPAHSPDELQRIVVKNHGKGADVTLKDGTILANENVSLVDGAFFVEESEHVENRDVDMFGEPLRVSTGGGENVNESSSVEIVENVSDVSIEIYNEPENVENQSADFSEQVDEDLNDLRISDVEESAIENLTNRFNTGIFEDIIDDFKADDFLGDFDLSFISSANVPGLINNPALNMSNLNLEMDEFKLLETASFIYNNSKTS